MKTTAIVLGAIIACFVSTTTLAAQEAPGDGGGCQDQCGTVYRDGVPIGHSCTGGGNRNRTNCKATVEDCTTDPCGGFALLTADGAVLVVGSCSERTALEDDQSDLIKSIVALGSRVSNAQSRLGRTLYESSSGFKTKESIGVRAPRFTTAFVLCLA